MQTSSILPVLVEVYSSRVCARCDDRLKSHSLQALFVIVQCLGFSGSKCTDTTLSAQSVDTHKADLHWKEVGASAPSLADSKQLAVHRSLDIFVYRGRVSEYIWQAKVSANKLLAHVWYIGHGKQQ